MNLHILLKVLETDFQSSQTNQRLFLNKDFKNDNDNQRWTRLGEYICSEKHQDMCIDFGPYMEDTFNYKAFVSKRGFSKTRQKWDLRCPYYRKSSKNIN